MSKKSVAISLPAKTPRAAQTPAPSHSEDWVREQDVHAGEDPMAMRPASRLVLDIAAERSLVEVMTLSALVPVALGWFWLMNATSGRMRF